MECGLYSRYFLVPKKDGGLRTILDLRPKNNALAKCSFKMITVKQILTHMQPWFISVDLRDAYFHIQIAPRHSRILRFVFKDRAVYKYKVYKCSAFPSQAEWNLHSELSGRLAQLRDTIENHR